jgi:predicted NUDIX family phosphoesterase
MRICCVDRAALPENWTRGTQVIREDFFARVPDSAQEWRERSEAEQDRNFKQIIPYILIEKDRRLLWYLRQGTEKRLHGLRSCGIGGHIDEADQRPAFRETVLAGLYRELSEELENFQAESLHLEYLGIINEEESLVGQVHLGLVYRGLCLGDWTPVPGEELGTVEWLGPGQQTAPEFSALVTERWSALALELAARTPPGAVLETDQPA